MNFILIGVLSYVGAQLLIGLLVSRRIKTEDDYLLAGRNLGYVLATFTLFATWFGAETCIGASAAIYDEGLSGGHADPFGYGLCLLFMGLVFAVPLWRRRLTTLADLFRLRYSRGVERLAVVLMVPTSVFWAAAQIRAFGQVLDATAGVGVPVAITIAAAVAIVYTAFGGLRADVITDLVQGIILIGGLVLLAVVVFGKASGAGPILDQIEPERLSLFAGVQGGWAAHLERWAVPICGSVMSQELVMRILAARSPSVAKRSAIMGAGLYLAVGLIPVSLGLFGPVLLPGLEDSEQLLPLLAREHLSAFLYVVFAGALVSAILSTVDSTLLAASSLASHNLVLPFFTSPSEALKVRMARYGVVGFGVIAYILALKGSTIYELVEEASAFGSAGIFVVAVAGLFTSFGGTWSAYGALVSGVTVWVIGSRMEYQYSYLASVAAAAGAYLIGAIVSRAVRGPEREATSKEQIN